MSTLFQNFKTVFTNLSDKKLISCPVRQADWVIDLSCHISIKHVLQRNTDSDVFIITFVSSLFPSELLGLSYLSGFNPYKYVYITPPSGRPHKGAEALRYELQKFTQQPMTSLTKEQLIHKYMELLPDEWNWLSPQEESAKYRIYPDKRRARILYWALIDSMVASHQSWARSLTKCAEAGWVRDLTCEGVEPNPGPPKTRVKKSVKRAKRILSLMTSKATRVTKKAVKQRVNNVNVSTGLAVRVPFKRREFVSNITSTILYGGATYTMNPAMPAFTWLSKIASNFEEYQFKSLRFIYKPTSGSAIASTNNALGAVMMAAQYDVYDTDFANKVEMEGYAGCVSGSPSRQLVYHVQTKTRQNPLGVFYTRSSETTIGGDNRLYDLGRFVIATEGMQAAGITLGELWVEYEVDLMKPKISKDPAAIVASHITEWPANSAAQATPFGSAGGIYAYGSSWDSNYAPLGTNYITLPDVGTYYISAMFLKQGGTAATTSVSLTKGANISTYGILQGGATYSYVALDTASTCFNLCCRVTIAGRSTDNRWTIGGLNAYAGGKVDLFIARLPFGIAEPRDDQARQIEELRRAFNALNLPRALDGKFGAATMQEPLSGSRDDDQYLHQNNSYPESQDSPIHVETDTMYVPRGLSGSFPLLRKTNTR